MAKPLKSGRTLLRGHDRIVLLCVYMVEERTYLKLLFALNEALDEYGRVVEEFEEMVYRGGIQLHKDLCSG